MRLFPTPMRLKAYPMRLKANSMRQAYLSKAPGVRTYVAAHPLSPRFDSPSLIFDSWSLIFDSWSLIFDSWSLIFDSWSLIFDSWSPIMDSWSPIMDSWGPPTYFWPFKIISSLACDAAACWPFGKCTAGCTGCPRLGHRLRSIVLRRRLLIPPGRSPVTRIRDRQQLSAVD